MKIFFFNPNDYGEEATVVAENKEQAIERLKATTPIHGDNQYHKDMVNKMVNCLDGYTIEEYPIEHVIFTEVAWAPNLKQAKARSQDR